MVSSPRATIPVSPARRSADCDRSVKRQGLFARRPAEGLVTGRIEAARYIPKVGVYGGGASKGRCSIRIDLDMASLYQVMMECRRILGAWSIPCQMVFRAYSVVDKDSLELVNVVVINHH